MYLKIAGVIVHRAQVGFIIHSEIIATDLLPRSIWDAVAD